MSNEVGQEDKQVLAFHLWHERGCPEGDPIADYYPAEWLLTRLRPYLALSATIRPLQLIAEVSTNLRESGFAEPLGVVMIVVLDGAREYGLNRYKEAKRRSPNNGVHPETDVDRKDREFYRICHAGLSLYGARVVEKSSCDSSTPEGDAPLADRRRYQDACVGAFARENQGPADSLCTAISAAVHLCRTLTTINEEKDLPWPEQFHARVVIGGSVEAAVSCLPSAWRDEIAIDLESWRSLPNSYQDLFLAAGGRVGPGTPTARGRE